MSTDSINIHTEEEYHDPNLGNQSVFSDIGQVLFAMCHMCGWASDTITIGEDEHPSGPVFLRRRKGESDEELSERCKDACAKLNSKWPEYVALLSMPIASITNIDAERRAKINVVASRPFVRVMALNPKFEYDSEKNGNAVGWQLITLPSIVDARARYKGYYTEPLFDPTALSGISETADATFVIPTLIEMRKSIWKALGESDWTTSYDETNVSKATKAEKLRDCLILTRNPWDGWVRLAQVSNPSVKAWYTSKTKGEDVRKRVPVVLEIFAGEKAAIEVGAKELAERGGDAQASNGKVTTEQFAALLPKTSAKAQVFGVDFASVAEAIYKDLGADPKKASKPQVIKVAKEYDVEVGDVELIRNL